MHFASNEHRAVFGECTPAQRRRHPPPSFVEQLQAALQTSSAAALPEAECPSHQSSSRTLNPTRRCLSWGAGLLVARSARPRNAVSDCGAEVTPNVRQYRTDADSLPQTILLGRFWPPLAATPVSTPVSQSTYVRIVYHWYQLVVYLVLSLMGSLLCPPRRRALDAPIDMSRDLFLSVTT